MNAILRVLDIAVNIFHVNHYHNWIDSLEGNEAHKSLYIRGVILFAKYLNLRGKISFVGMHPPYKSDFTPYIYSEEEIATLFSTVDKWRDYSINPGSIALVMPTLLRLIYSTGMRIGEALSITNIDVDFTRHSICLRKTKNNHERYCAITPTMEIVIKEYIRYRNMLPVAGVDAPHALLFCNNIGGKVNAKAVRVRFHNILIASGFKVTPSGYLPRIHDLRHTACVHTMKKMIAAGKDIYCCMPQLAVYMGHCDPKDTEYYLRLTPTAFPELLAMDAKTTMPITEIVNLFLSKQKV